MYLSQLSSDKVWGNSSQYVLLDLSSFIPVENNVEKNPLAPVLENKYYYFISSADLASHLFLSCQLKAVF